MSLGSGEPSRFEKTFLVGPEDIDALGHVNNVVYLSWVQEIAEAHWLTAARPEDLESIVWVATRHEIDYAAPAFEGDEILVRTWVESWTAVRSERRTEILRLGEDSPLARALTSWCALDAETMRPRRMPTGLSERFVRSLRPPGT